MAALLSFSPHPPPPKKSLAMGSAQSQPAPPATQPLPAGIPPPGCPMHDSSAPKTSPSSDSPLNPRNNIPNLKQAPAPGQKAPLPLERTISSIPRAGVPGGSPSACPVASGSGAAAPTTDAAAPAKADQWEYPSPQQFYNALVRKGWETPEESVEMMVNIHNWLNEAAWQQVRQWEEKHVG